MAGVQLWIKSSVTALFSTLSQRLHYHGPSISNWTEISEARGLAYIAADLATGFGQKFALVKHECAGEYDNNSLILLLQLKDRRIIRIQKFFY